MTDAADVEMRDADEESPVSDNAVYFRARCSILVLSKIIAGFSNSGIIIQETKNYENFVCPSSPTTRKK
jgi:hypothetical protein